MPEQHILLVMEIIDNIVLPDDRKRKYTDRQIVKLLIVLQIFRISYRSARIFLTNHEEYLRMIGLKRDTKLPDTVNEGEDDRPACSKQGDSIPLFHGIRSSSGFLHDPHMQVFYCSKEKGMGQV